MAFSSTALDFLAFRQRHSGDAARNVEIAIAEKPFGHQARDGIGKDIGLKALVDAHDDFNISVLVGNLRPACAVPAG